jgi:hypothetical protein
MIRKSVKRFSEKIMLKQSNKELKRDDDSTQFHRALARCRVPDAAVLV